MSINGKTFIERFNRYCPESLAEVGDPVGLHIGTLNKEINRVLVTLDVRPEVVEEAIEKEIDLIIAKHPPIFRPIKRLAIDDIQTKMYTDLLKNDIAVFTAHTNMDIIENGLNDWFCEELSIGNTNFLTKTHSIPYKKMIVFTPVDNASLMREALGKAGAGSIGDYQNVSFSSVGTGRFTPVEGANPAIGQINQEEAVQEVKIEVIFLQTLQKQVVDAMKAVHPYEEPAYDLFVIENFEKEYGLGRIGYLKEAVPLKEFVNEVKKVFALDGLRLVANDDNQLVKKIAICGGSGEKFFPDALRQQADVYITGDVYYHTGHDMLSEGLAVIDPGHYIEQLCKPKLVKLFNQWKKDYNWDVTFIASEIDTNPFQFR
ncbi:Nif3-like dinuclear metal center hexameric protein [Enterococcus sp. LJL99]